MALFTHVQAPSDLPPPGTSYEREHIDFKRRISGSGTYELAKDVAAFANRTGGVLLIGVEDEKDQLARYVPLTADEARQSRTRFIDAVKDRCFPSPKCEIEIIEYAPGFVVAVNVWPVPGQPVGVKVPVAKVAGDKIADSAFVFPVRVLTGTDYLEPQELAKVMLPELRRCAIALEQIPTKERDSLRISWRPAIGEGHSETGGSLHAVDINTGRAHFAIVFGRRSLAVELPLEAVAAVQPIGGQGLWRISLIGQLVEQSEIVQWNPPRS